METLHIDHLIVGGGLLGLATADQILRRGGGSVLVVEAEPAPNRRGLGGGGVVLRTGLDAYRAIEDRALFLLEEWPDYLGVDPDYSPLPQRSVRDGDVPPQNSGFVDVVRLLSALHEHVRGRGARVIFDAQLEKLERTGEGWSFRAAGRSGTAGQVYFTGAATDLRWLRELELAPPTALSYWHEFHLVHVPEHAEIRAVEVPRPEPEIVGLTLELDMDPDDTDPDTTAADVQRICWVQDGCGEGRLLVEGEETTSIDNPTVDWSELERCRQELAESIPELAGASVRRGTAELLWSLDRHPQPSDLSAWKQRDGLWISGAFGMHTPLLALGIAELIAAEVTG